MLPYLAASGHNLYTKSVYLYLQDMAKIHELHPEVHARFLEGYLVIHRSDRFWAGLSLDLAIEQILMRSVKTTGGLTRWKRYVRDPTPGMAVISSYLFRGQQYYAEILISFLQYK